jgi:hypothetical protein
MSGLPAVTQAEHHRARRWDALVLGSGIPSLVAAVRLGLAGHRVLVVEEDRARDLHPALRAPFFLAGVRDQGVLDTLLRDLKIPLIDQRRIENERVAMQVVSPKIRLDLGGPGVTARELVAWGLCDREEAGALVRSLVESTEIERKLLLEAPVVRLGRRIGRARVAPSGTAVRGLPADLAHPPEDLATIFDAIADALSNLGAAAPTPEAKARLLGCGLAGGAGFGDGPPWLHGLLRRRVESVYGEFRTLGPKFELVSLDGSPAVRLTTTGELWVGRSLLIGAPLGALSSCLEPDAARTAFGEPRPHARRLTLHLRAAPEVLPQGMCPRVVLMGHRTEAGPGQGPMTLNVSIDPDSQGRLELVARTRLAAGDDEPEEEAARQAMLARVHELMPFSEGRLEERAILRPRWDDEDWLEDPVRGEGWPSEVDLRLPGKSGVYRLDRAGVAGLGLEGDLLLGWRAGDAVAADLA